MSHLLIFYQQKHAACRSLRVEIFFSYCPLGQHLYGNSTCRKQRTQVLDPVKNGAAQKRKLINGIMRAAEMPNAHAYPGVVRITFPAQALP